MANDQSKKSREQWEYEVDRDLLRIGIITAGIFSCVLVVFALIMWWVQS